MYQIVHGASGLLIGSQTGNPWLAFILGVVFHFILDFIPHDSIEIERWQIKSNYVKKTALIAAIDIWLFLIMILILQINGLLTIDSSLLAALAGALLLDYIWGFQELFKIKSRILDRKFHEKIHAVFYKPIYLPAKYVIPIQLGTLIIILTTYIILNT